MQYKILNFHYAEQIFDSPEFQEKRFEIFDIVKRCPVIKLDKPKHRTRKDKKTGKRIVSKTFTTNQSAINKYFEDEFKVRNWQVSPHITQDGKTQLQADYKKERVQVEVQFGNMARWYTDVFKMQVSYAQNLIDIGVLIVPMQNFANTIDENIAYFERIERELPYAKLSITLPILVIGIAPRIPKNTTLNGS
jgi:hypothetical protein